MYVSLHNRSAYSFGSSLTQPHHLAAFAASCNMPAVALTDKDGLYAAIHFKQACGDAGIKPIIGVEFEIQGDIKLTLLAQSIRGYSNLCRLVTRRHLQDEPLSIEDCCGHSTDVVCITGQATNINGLRTAIAGLRDAFAPRLYIQLAIHQPGDVRTARQRARLADELGIPVVASCESRCLQREDMLPLQALASIGTLTLLDRPHPDKPAGFWHVRTPAEMERLFQRRPDALRNTLTIAETCRFDLELYQNRFPSFDVADGRSPMQYLRDLCIHGCYQRYVHRPPQRGMGGIRPTIEQALARLERELSVIDQVDYAEYFLVFHEIVEYCRREGIAVLARGSAADSLVCYALGVSHACPFRFDLPFDRFLNPERAKFSKMADIDLDLPWDRREQVIRWVYERWGNERVAMIGTVNTFHARAAISELGKIFGLPPHEVHRLTKLLSHVTSWDVARSITRSPETRDFPVNDEPYRTIFRLARRLEGLPRHWAMHPCGLIVSPTPLTDLVPVQRSPLGPLVAQYDMDSIEELGFIKIDLLGQAGLSVLRDTVAEIHRTENINIDLERDVDYSDTDTWEGIAIGHARGVHHIESPAMTSLITQCDCRDIDALTNIVAIIRPGASNQGKKDVYARRSQGFEPVTYAHPCLETVLGKTFGLMVFEEQIIQIAVEFAGMNLGRADVLRRALNKENRERIAEMKNEFIAVAAQNGRMPQEIEAVWAVLEGFAGFMFNKAHSAEYAVEAFQGMWLKHRWPAHFLAAVLSNYRGFYANSPTLPQIVYVMEALRLGIGFLPPCVNRSRARFSIEYRNEPSGRKPMIRLPVSHIKGMPDKLIDRYLSEREKGEFNSLADFMRRCEPVDSESHLLLDSGALDIFGLDRPALFWRLRNRPKKDCRGSRTLWDKRDDTAEIPPIPLTHPDQRQIAQREMDLLGFPVTLDPLTLLGPDIDWRRYVPVAEMKNYAGRRVRACGLMVADRVNSTTQGGLMKFVTLADRSGFVETLLFPNIYRRFGHLTVANPILEVIGKVEMFENNNGFTLNVESVSPPAAPAASEQRMRPILDPASSGFT